MNSINRIIGITGQKKYGRKYLNKVWTDVLEIKKIMKYLRLKVFVYSNSPLSAGECSRTPRGYMKPCRAPNPIYIYTLFFPTHNYNKA